MPATAPGTVLGAGNRHGEKWSHLCPHRVVRGQCTSQAVTNLAPPLVGIQGAAGVTPQGRLLEGQDI